MSDDLSTTKQSKPVGRPTKCTPAVVRLYCEAIGKHLPPDSAAAYAGLSPKTVENWFAQALAGEEPYATFAAEAARARARSAATLTGNIEAAGQADPRYWRASAWLLTHGYSAAPALPVLQAGALNRGGEVVDASDLSDEERLLLERIDRMRTDLERARIDGSHGSVLQLSRDLDRATAALTEARRSKQTNPADQDEATYLELLAGAAEGMPETHLRVFVDAYCRRHRVTLTKDPRWKRDEGGEWYLEEEPDDVPTVIE